MGFSLLGCIPYSGEVHRFLLLVAVFILPGCIPYSGEVHRYSFLVTGFLLPGCIPYSGEVHRYSLLVAGFILPGFSPVYRLTSGCIPKYSWVHPEVSINPSVLSEKSRQNASRFQKWIAVHLSTIRDPSRHFFYSVRVCVCVFGFVYVCVWVCLLVCVGMYLCLSCAGIWSNRETDIVQYDNTEIIGTSGRCAVSRR